MQAVESVKKRGLKSSPFPNQAPILQNMALRMVWTHSATSLVRSFTGRSAQFIRRLPFKNVSNLLGDEQADWWNLTK